MDGRTVSHLSGRQVTQLGRCGAGIRRRCAGAPLASAAVREYAVTALNPKSILFFVAFLPHFIDPTGNVDRQLWIVAITFVILATINAALYAVFASAARRLLASGNAQRRFNVLGGSVLSAAGIWALLAKKPV